MGLTPRIALLVAVIAGVFAPLQAARPPQKRRPATASQSTRGRTPPPAARGKEPAATAPKQERPVPFSAGETLTYDVSWASYLTAGTATVSVREKKPSYGSTAYYVVAEGRPTPLLSKLYTVYYKADSLIDVYSLLPQRGSVYSEEGRHKRMKVTLFDQGAHKASYEVQTATVVKKEVRLPAYAQDALSAVYVLRAIPLQSGAKMTIPVTDSGDAYKVQVVVGSREPVRAGIGTVDAWKITPTLMDLAGHPDASRKLALWISDDARKLPVKMQADVAVGSFSLTLRDVRQ